MRYTGYGNRNQWYKYFRLKSSAKRYQAKHKRLGRYTQFKNIKFANRFGSKYKVFVKKGPTPTPYFKRRRY